MSRHRTHVHSTGYLRYTAWAPWLLPFPQPAPPPLELLLQPSSPPTTRAATTTTTTNHHHRHDTCRLIARQDMACVIHAPHSLRTCLPLWPSRQRTRTSAPVGVGLGPPAPPCQGFHDGFIFGSRRGGRGGQFFALKIRPLFYI